jgi:kinesin family protein 2/24
MEIAQAAHESARAGGGPDAEAADAAANIEAWRAAGLPPAQPHAGPKGSGAKAGNIKVCMRKRPLSAREAAGVGRADERGRHEFDAVSVSNPNAWFHELEYGEAGVSRLVKTGGVAGRKYEFHHTFGEADDNDEVYADCVSELVPFVLKGGVATCVAYGQTGAGKTYTQVGMQDRLARDLLAGAASMVRRGKWPDAALAAEFSFFENQGERCFDLQNHREELVLREDGDGHVHVAGLTSVKVTTVEELHVVLQAANQLRATAPTQSNPESSRSHAICTFRIGAGENIGTLRVIDLAGCERHESVDEHTPERIAEMKDINWSLGCLKECIRLQREALASRKPPGSEDHIPYRRSKLTMLLKDCFTSSNVRTVFLAHVAPTAMSAQYTKNTLGKALTSKQAHSHGPPRCV